MPASPTALNHMAKNLIRARANPMPASAKAPRRASIARTTRRAAKSALHPARRSRRCPPGRAVSDRKFGDKKPYASRDGGGEKRPFTPRSEGFRKDGDRPRGDRPFRARPPREGDRPRGDRPDRKFGGDKKFSRGAPDLPARIFEPGSRTAQGSRRSSGIAAIQSRGRSVMPARPITPDATRVRRATVQEASTSRVSTSPVMTPREDRGGDERPRFSRPREDRPQGDRPRSERPNSTVRANGLKAAPTGRSIRAARQRSPIGRAATMKTTARYSPSARPSAAAANIASASRTSRSARHGRRAKRNPASASPRWCRAPVSPRAATPRNGSCRAASRSTAA